MSTATTSTDAELPPYDGPMFDAHDKQYLLIALGLGIMTAIEITLSYTSLKHAALALPLLLLAAIKFMTVAGYFMHLKLDTPVFRRLFIIGAVLAGFVYMGVLYAFHKITGPVGWVIYLVSAIALIATFVLRGTSRPDDDHHDVGATDDHDVAHAH